MLSALSAESICDDAELSRVPALMDSYIDLLLQNDGKNNDEDEPQSPQQRRKRLKNALDVIMKNVSDNGSRTGGIFDSVHTSEMHAEKEQSLFRFMKRGKEDDTALYSSRYNFEEEI